MSDTVETFLAQGDAHFVLDLDGTLADFRDFPEDVSLSPRARSTLKALARFPVTVLSGRAPDDLRRITSELPVDSVGLNGNTQTKYPDAARIAEKLRLLGEQFSKTHFENKSPHFSMHYRMSHQPELGPEIVSTLEAWLHTEKLDHVWRVYEGSYVVNIEPRGDFKREWLLRYLESHPTAHVLFAGDDANDRGALELRHPRLRTLLVGTAAHMESTRADFRAETTVDFVRLLESLSVNL